MSRSEANPTAGPGGRPDADTDLRISAMLDGELSALDEAVLRANPALADRIAELEEADAMARHILEAELEPAPQRLLDLLEPAPQAPPTTFGVPRWRLRAQLPALAVAACFGAAAMLGVEWLQVQTRPPIWLSEIASYHRVYAAEGRHLVEVPAAEAAHIETWLGGRVGAFAIPDLTEVGLRFEGARLLVAAGQPVAQLVYRGAEDRIYALCISPRPGAEPRGPETRRLSDITTVDWRTEGQARVLVGPTNGPPLSTIFSAVTAATEA